MNLVYEASDGDVLNLMYDPIFAQNPEVLNEHEWNYSTVTGASGRTRVKRFYQEKREHVLQLSIMADSKAEFNEIMYRMHQMFDADVQNETQGKVWWNEYYKSGYFVKFKAEEFDEHMESVDCSVTFLTTDNMWKKVNTQNFTSGSAAGTSEYLDYNYDFSYDYKQTDVINTVINNGIAGSNFDMYFYGPCSNPYCILDGNIYGVNVDLSEGEYVMISSGTKKIRQYDQYGVETNVFNKRNRDGNAFYKIPRGTYTVMMPDSMKMSLTIYDERGEAEWI